MPDQAPRFTTRLWSEEVAAVDPEATSNEQPVAYVWSNGRKFLEPKPTFEPPTE